jgi:hypothetical protein
MATCQREETWYFPRLRDLYSQQHYYGLNIYIPFAYYDFMNGFTWWDLRYFDPVQRSFFLIPELNEIYDEESEEIKISYHINDQLPTPIRLRFDYYQFYEDEPLPEIKDDIVFEFCTSSSSESGGSES